MRKVTYLQPAVDNLCSCFRESENNQSAERRSAEGIDHKRQHFIPDHRTVATAAKLLVKRMIYGGAAITTRWSQCHIDSPPDGLSSLIASWAVDKYLFETQMGGGQRNVLDGFALQLEWKLQSTIYF